MKKGLCIVFVFVVLGFIAYFVFFHESYQNDVFVMQESISIPSSTYHENGTWWGYNQTKIMRDDEVVITYYIDNQNQVNGVANLNNPNQAVLLMIKNQAEVVEFDRINTSRPINILVDEQRHLIYAISIEPTMENDNGSTGKLVVYTYSLVENEITFVSKRVIVDHNGFERETVNIRTGATIDASGNIAIVYGLADASYTFSIVVQLYDVENDLWYEESVYMNGVNEPNFYPDIAMKNLNDFVVVAVQDNCVDYQGSCAYLYLRYFIFQDGMWTYDYLADYRSQITDTDNLSVTEHTEVYLDHEGIYHLVWRSKIKEKEYHHAYINSSNEIIIRDLSVNRDMKWLRIVEVEDVKYFIGHGNGRTQILDFDTLEVLHNDQSSMIESAYFYVYSDNTQIDCLILNGDASTYHDQADEYVRFTLLNEE